ncbi:MAG: hypothetical protein MUO23_06875 [Anaerolineales bacterium]|nr:hypothetical protein [Anaerolineales bacterium]
MSEILALVSHVIPMALIRRERQLPAPGTVIARLNEKVLASDVIAEGELAPSHVFLDLVRALGVHERDVARYLLHQAGDRLEAGELIAGPAGVGRRTVRAPAPGRIVTFHRGRLLYEVRGKPIGLRAGFPGMIIGTDGTRSVTLETPGALVQGIWGNGRQEFAMLRTVGGAGESIRSDQLDINLRGALLIGGILNQAGPLQQMTQLTVRGLVVGSATFDLVAQLMRMPFPVVLTEGFGEIPMNSAAYGLLTTSAGREAAIDARMGDAFSQQRPEIIIPLPATRKSELPEEVVALTPGTRVRVLRPPYAGAVGAIRDLPTKAVDYPSGLLARSALVELEGTGTRSVPLANLEVIQ